MNGLQRLSIVSDPELIQNIRTSSLLTPHVTQLATSQTSTPTGSTLGSRSQSFSDDGGDGGAAEIATLARRILEITEDGPDGVHSPAGDNKLGSAPGDEDVLRKSVREALQRPPPADE